MQEWLLSNPMEMGLLIHRCGRKSGVGVTNQEGNDAVMNEVPPRPLSSAAAEQVLVDGSQKGPWDLLSVSGSAASSYLQSDVLS